MVMGLSGGGKKLAFTGGPCHGMVGKRDRVIGGVFLTEDRSQYGIGLGK